MRKIIVLFMLLCFLFAGCEQNQYQIVKDADGKVYRLNKKTGEMVIIKDGKVIPLDTSKSLKLREVSEESLGQPLEWGEQQISGKKLKVKLRTSWKKGKLYYVFTVLPYASLRQMFIEKERGVYSGLKWFGFIIELMDDNGFIIKKIPIGLWEMTKVIDKNGETKELSANYNLECTKDEYESITRYTPTWVLDIMDLIPNRESGDIDKGN